jgi:hypothetical protein
VPAHDCGTSATALIKNNIAHATAGGHKGGNGHYVFRYGPSSSQETCMEATSLISYKCWNQGTYAYDKTKKIVFTNMTSIDNNLGLGALIANKLFEYEPLVLEVTNSFINGETEILDCPSLTNGDYCELYDKMGIYPFSSTYGDRGTYPTSSSALPIYKIKSDAAWGG